MDDRPGKSESEDTVALPALIPFERALHDYWHCRESQVLLVEYSDGHQAELPVSIFFREPSAFHPSEWAALELCRGSILNIGAGTGVHALVLQARDLLVTAIDVCPEMADIMRQRGVARVRCEDFWNDRKESYDTLLLLGQNVGMAGTLRGLGPFLAHCRQLLNPGGQLLLNSTEERAGRRSPSDGSRYHGEQEFRLHYQDLVGPWMKWLHVDYPTLVQHASEAGWQSRLLDTDESGTFSAQLVPHRSAPPE